MEIYSIDEAFLNLDFCRPDTQESFGRSIVARVRRNTGIPTSLGIAPTKTLAKIAALFAKKYPAYHAVCIIDSEEKRRKALRLTNIDDVWGIGRRLSRRMHSIGIHSALDLADRPKADIERLLNIVGERTWRELNGEPCITMNIVEPAKKQMCCSRSFAEDIYNLDRLSEPLPLLPAVLALSALSTSIRELLLSLSTFSTTWPISSFSSAINSDAEYSPRSMRLSLFSHRPVSLALFSSSSCIVAISCIPASEAIMLLPLRYM